MSDCKDCDAIVAAFPEIQKTFFENDTYLVCNVCSKEDSSTTTSSKETFKYTTCCLDESGCLTDDFKNVKFIIKRHLASETHKKNQKKKAEREKKSKALENRNTAIGMRIGRIAYDSYQEGFSRRMFEKKY